MIKFSELEGHKYTSVIPDNREWQSITSIIGNLKNIHNKFNAVEVSEACSKKVSSKYYGLTPQEIRDLWDAENKRSIDLGKWYHYTQEKAAIEENAIVCIERDGWKYARDQVFTEDGVYPEFILYHPEAGICGQADKIIVKDGKFSIIDYKTNKNLSVQSFNRRRMQYPLERLEDHTFNHYIVQLSLYCAMIKYHNPDLTLDKLQIQHIRFKSESFDRFGYPRYRTDPVTGEYLVTKVNPITVPYLKYEANLVIDWKIKEQSRLAHQKLFVSPEYFQNQEE